MGQWSLCSWTYLWNSSAVLIDSGSTSTLLSYRVYKKIEVDKRPQLKEQQITVQDINGNCLHVYGLLDVDIKMDEKILNHHFLICDIAEEGIIGQDFLLKFIDKIDYKGLRLITGNGDISCWIGGEAEMISRVTVKRTTQLQPNTVTWVPINVLKSEFLAEDGIIEVSHSISETHRVCLISGIVNTRADDKYIPVINFDDSETILNINTDIGTCESYYEQNQPIHRCASITIKPEIPAVDQLPDHLKDMFERSSTELETNEKDAFAELLLKYQNIFSKTPEDLGKTDRVQHRINTGHALPVRQPPRRQPIGKREAEKSELEKMLKLGIIEPSNSAWASLIVLVTKKDGSTRFCVDYRKLNDLTVKDAYPLPRVDDCLDSLSGSKWFCSMDLNSGYWQIGMTPEDREREDIICYKFWSLSVPGYAIWII